MHHLEQVLYVVAGLLLEAQVGDVEPVQVVGAQRGGFASASAALFAAMDPDRPGLAALRDYVRAEYRAILRNLLHLGRAAGVDRYFGPRQRQQVGPRRRSPASSA